MQCSDICRAQCSTGLFYFEHRTFFYFEHRAGAFIGSGACILLVQKLRKFDTTSRRMARKRRSPFVLVKTAAAVNAVLNSSGCSSVSTAEEDLGPVRLRAGLLLWQGAKTEDLRRHAGKDSAIFDESTTVGVSESVLRRLGLPSGSWVTVKDTSTNVTKPARVMVLDPLENSVSMASRQDEAKSFPAYRLNSGNRQRFDPGHSFLSPVLAFNLGIYISWLEYLTSFGFLLDDESRSPPLQESSTRLSGVCTGATPQYFVEIAPFVRWVDHSLAENATITGMSLDVKTPATSSQVTYAAHMRIGLIRVPSENAVLTAVKERQSYIDLALQEYFKIDRFLGKGDVFSVQVGPVDSPLQLLSIDSEISRKNVEQEFIFFKVLALEPPTETLLCSNYNHTALVLGGPVASQLPPLSRASHLHLHFVRTLAVQQLESLLAPCLHPRVFALHLRLSVLLHGPSGSGKQTVVRLAAEDLGMHVVEYNCYEFVGATEGKMTTAMMNAFKIAKRYSPCVLLLRCFDVLGKSSPGGNSNGILSRVMSVLKTCIAAHLPSPAFESYDDTSFSGEFSDVQKEWGSLPVKVAGIGNGPKEGLVLVVGTCESAENLSPELRRCFTHEVLIGLPSEDQRLSLLHHYLGVGDHQTVGTENLLDETVEASLKAIAAQTSGLTPRDLRAVAADAGAAAVIQCSQDGQEMQDANPTSKANHLPDINANGRLSVRNRCDITCQGSVLDTQRSVQVSAKDLELVLGRVKLRTASAIGTPKVPNVKWEDVGGLEDVKKAILDTVQLPLVHRELFASGLRQRSGVLLYGPPGTGKTLLAKAVATECTLNFLSVKGPELINMYIGESEKNVREIFQKARTAKPCVVFFDELDALAPARGASGDSGGVMDRVVSQMLAEIDGVSDNSQDLFIIGASNRPDLIDPALLRPGRFDKLLYVGVSAETSYRERVLQALTRKFQLDKNVSLKAVAQKCPVTYTGADMYALCADAWHQAVKREVLKLERRKASSSNTSADEVIVKEEDFLKAMQELAPSLSQVELDRYDRLRAQFEGK